MTSIFPEIFAPPRTATNGRSGSREAPSEVRELPLHQQAGDRGMQHARDALGGRVRPVGGAERVVDVQVAEPGELAGQALVVRLLAGQEARVLQHEHLTVAQVLGGLQGLVGVGRLAEVDPGAGQQFGEAALHGLERVLGVGRALGPAEVREQHHARAVLDQVPQGGQRGLDAGVVGDLASVVERHVEVDAHERAPAAELASPRSRTVFLFIGVRSAWRPAPQPNRAPMNRSRSTQRDEYPHSLSYHPLTLTIVPSITLVDSESTMHECGFPM
jgi:hypothetical protein